MEHRVTLTITEHGRRPESGDAALTAFQQLHPDLGPVVSQDPALGTMSITIALDADDAHAALDAAKPVFVDGLNASGLEKTRSVGLAAEAVPADELAGAELEPA